MKKRLPVFKIISVILVVILSFIFIAKRFVVGADSSNASVTLSPSGSSQEQINVNLANSMPAGNIIDIEVYNSQNQKVFQTFSTNGGNNFSATTSTLPMGSYQISVGLFTPNWGSNYAWYGNINSFSLPNNNLTPTPTSSPITVNVSTASANTENINLNMLSVVPAGNIVDIEVYDSNNSKVWQTALTNGGNNFSATTSALPSDNYKISVGLFTPNWGSNYAWYGNAASFNLSSPPSPSLTPTVNSQIIPNPVSTLTPAENNSSDTENAAMAAYENWKSKYVFYWNNMARVDRPENNNDTVSEGIGYGMLLSYFANDKSTFGDLWNYAKNYLDRNGLMSWDISSSGAVIGTGAASDADSDMAYALVKASEKGWGYETDAKKLLANILNYEIYSDTNLVKPGDSWGNTTTINPSYIAPSYYPKFASFTGDSRWNLVEAANILWLSNANNTNTGLLPDWLNSNYSPATDVSFDSNANNFYYDAMRIPMRIYMGYKVTGDNNLLNILKRQYNFLSSVNLVSGYTMSGAPISNYLDDGFLASYATLFQINPNSDIAKNTLLRLINTTPDSYYSASLRTLNLFIIANY